MIKMSLIYVDINFENNVFNHVRPKIVFAHCIMTLLVLTGTDEKRERCIFPILPANVPHGL